MDAATEMHSGTNVPGLATLVSMHQGLDGTKLASMGALVQMRLKKAVIRAGSQRRASESSKYETWSSIGYGCKMSARDGLVRR